MKKLIFENKWSSYLNESKMIQLAQQMKLTNQIKKNIAFILNNAKGSSQYKHLALILQDLYQEKKFSGTPLETVTITRYIAAGSFAYVFEDSDGHIFKLGFIRDEATENDLALYNQKTTKSFIVYYFKLFEGTNFFIAITNKVMTFGEYVDFVNHSNKSKTRFGGLSRDDYIPDFYFKFATAISNYVESVSNIPKEVFQYISGKKEYHDFVSGIIKRYGLSKENAISIALLIISKYCQLGPSADLHFGNLGVNIVSGIDNPMFFYFDQ